jgi:hypothetical protein
VSESRKPRREERAALLAALDVAEASLDHMAGKTDQFVVDGLTLALSATLAPEPATHGDEAVKAMDDWYAKAKAPEPAECTRPMGSGNVFCEDPACHIHGARR